MRGLSERQTDTLLALRQFQRYPDRWNAVSVNTSLSRGTVLDASKEEKERWFDEEMLRRPGDDRLESLEG